MAYGQKIKQFQPIEDFVLVEPWEGQLKTASGLVLPQGAQVAKTGTVIQVGPGKYAPETGKKIPMQVEAGNVVFFGDIQAIPVEVDGRALLLFRHQYIYGVIEAEDN